MRPFAARLLLLVNMASGLPYHNSQFAHCYSCTLLIYFLRRANTACLVILIAESVAKSGDTVKNKRCQKRRHKILISLLIKGCLARLYTDEQS